MGTPNTQGEMATVFGIPEELYLHASEWLQPVLKQVILSPIARQRYHAFHDAICQELRDRASDHGTTPKYELILSARKALSLVIDGLTVPTRLFDPCDPASPEAAEYARRKIQAKINDEVTKDLLGPGWRHWSKEEPLGASDTDVAPQEQYERDGAKLFTVMLLTDSRLSPRERDFLKAMRDHGSVIADAAQELGIASSTARTMFQRIRSKRLDEHPPAKKLSSL